MMIETWVAFTLLAVIMQSVRTAGQKKIANSISIEAATLVRFLFGLPFAFLYFLFLKSNYAIDQVQVDSQFYRSASLAGVSQIFATFFLVKALTIKNFAVGTALSKTEAILTAVIGAWFFSASLSFNAYLAVLFGVGGVLIASNWKITLKDLVENKSIKYGIGAGLGFAMASLWIRDASLSMAVPRLFSAATTLLYMVALQTTLCLLWLLATQRQQFRLILQNFKASLFIGFTAVAGSIGWFTAMSLQNAAVVKTLGQVEFGVTLLITYLYFGEKITRREYLGMGLVALSVLMLLWDSA